MRRLLVYGLPSCLLAFLLFALLHGCAPDGAETPLDLDDERGAVPTPALLTAEGDEAAADGAPRLARRALPDARSDRAQRGPVTVLVVGAGGEPLSGVFVALAAAKQDAPWYSWSRGPPVRNILETDVRGEVVYRDLPYDGSVSVVVHGRSVRSGGRDAHVLPLFGLRTYAVPVWGERVVFRAALGVRLHVQVVEAETGRRVARATVAIVDAYGRPAEAPGGSALLRWQVEEKHTLSLSVQPSSGRLAWDVPAWPVHISPYAKQLRAYYPLRREVGVTLTVLEPDRRPTEAPEVFDVRAAGRLVPASRRATDGYGRLRITGVPFLPGELLSLKARRRGGVVQAGVSDRIPADPDEELHLEVTLPPEPEDPSNIGMGGGAGGKFGGRGSSRSFGTGGGHARPKGGVVVVVRRHDGSAAQGALVYLGQRKERTDLNGRAHFTSVHPGEYAVRVEQVGLLPLAGRVTVRGEEQARLVLREGPGGRLEVRVVDETGRPLAYARLHVETPSKQPWIDLKNGIQRVDPFTDHEGRRVLHGLEPGTIVVRAGWGSRSGVAKIDVTTGEPLRAKIVLARP